MKTPFVPVQVLHLFFLEIGSLDLFPRPECPVNDVSGRQALQLGADERPALAGLDMLKFDDGERFSVELDFHAPLDATEIVHKFAIDPLEH